MVVEYLEGRNWEKKYLKENRTFKNIALFILVQHSVCWIAHCVLYVTPMQTCSFQQHVSPSLPGNIRLEQRTVFCQLAAVDVGCHARWPSGLESWFGTATGHSRPGSNPTSVKTFRFGTMAIPFTLLWQCLSDETLLKAVGPLHSQVKTTDI